MNEWKDGWNLSSCVLGNRAGFLGPAVFSLERPLEADASFNEHLKVSANSWEMEAAHALEKPGKARLFKCQRGSFSGDGDVIAGMRPVWRFTWEVEAEELQRGRNLCEQKFQNKNETLKNAKWMMAKCWSRTVSTCVLVLESQMNKDLD